MRTSASYLQIAASFFVLAALAGCGESASNPLYRIGPVQIESPPPMVAPGSAVEAGPEISPRAQPIPGGALSTIGPTYHELKVRVFPILSVPPKDPYPVTKDTSELVLYNSRGLEVKTLDGQKLGEGKKITVDTDRKVLAVDGLDLSLDAVTVTPKNASITTTVRYDDGRVNLEYRGRFEIQSTEHSVVNRATGALKSRGYYWSLINLVSLQEYLHSVVASEMPASFSAQALRAQSVAARTYAVYHAYVAREVIRRQWDVDPTTWYQSYRGALVEAPKTVTPAVDATVGEILVHQDKLIEAFFSSNSGGYTCSISECFGMPDRGYIVPREDVSGVRQKPGGLWTAQITTMGVHARLVKMEREKKLRIEDVIPGFRGPSDIQGLLPFEVGPSQRTVRLGVRAGKAGFHPLNAMITKEMRWQFGLKTNFYRIESLNGSGVQAVEGYGLGHGVGMSQWGAQVLGTMGTEYKDILNFYYHDTQVLKF